MPLEGATKLHSNLLISEQNKHFGFTKSLSCLVISNVMERIPKIVLPETKR